jgi:germacradienol/geosmin synthase
MTGAMEYIERLTAFMPIYPTDNLPAPTNPVERGLTSLWCPTVFTKSVDWRLRFFESTKNQYDSSLCELTNINQDRVANPIEYIELRRMVGGAPWSADLTEHAVFVDIPAEIMKTRPLQVLKDTFSDAVHLHNDLFSYQREVHEEGEKSNCVLVLETFLNVDTQRSANLTNDLLTSRLQQFEHTAITELPLLFEEQALDPAIRANVLIYVKALRDWLSGSHEWHIRSSRYMNEKLQPSSISMLGAPTGLSASAVCVSSVFNTLDFRLKNYSHIPYKHVGITELPKFYMPFSPKLNPNLEIARRHSKQWARQMGILDFLPGFPNVFVWDERKFDAADLALNAALTQPNISSSTQFDLTVCWFLWGTYADDYFPKVYGNGRNMKGAKLFVARLSEFMPVNSTTTPTPINPVELALSDLWVRTTEQLSTDEKRLFRYAAEDFTGGWLWELANHIQNRIPDPVDFVEMRRKTFGWEMTKWFTLRMGQYSKIPVTIYRTRTIRELGNIAIDYICLANDIFSYQKEIEFEGELSNGVLVAQSFLGCDKVQAVEIVNNLMTARMQQFENLIATELPVIFDHFNLDTQSQQNLYDYIENLCHWMCGTLQWHLSTTRYKESELQNERLRSKTSIGFPTGLGTSTARIGVLLKANQMKTITESIQSVTTQNNGLGTSAIRIVELLKAGKIKTITESVQSTTQNNGLGTSAIRIVEMLKANQG